MAISKVVFPGDIIPCLPSSPLSPDANSTSKMQIDSIQGETKAEPARVKLGNGLFQNEENVVIATKVGVLKNDVRHGEDGGDGAKWWVEGSQKRYIPAFNDLVIGIILSKHAEFYKVDIGAAHTAMLPALAFEGATKRNKPNIQPGALVYARVSLVTKDLDPELDCVNPTTGKADGFGELKGGFMWKVGLGLARSLLNPSHPVLITLGTHIPFELAIGVNGRIWVNVNPDASNPNASRDRDECDLKEESMKTILIMNAIRNSEFIRGEEIKKMVERVVKEIGG